MKQFSYATSRNNNDQFKVALSTTEGTYFFKTSDIIRMEADRAYTHFYLADKRRIVASKPLREYEDLLEQHGFCRVHKSHLVNLTYAEHYETGGYVKLKDGQRIEVARRRKDEVLQALWRA
jgi:two-component system, LytTR family, response regulator